jgi:hypothetical protein
MKKLLILVIITCFLTNCDGIIDAGLSEDNEKIIIITGILDEKGSEKGYWDINIEEISGIGTVTCFVRDVCGEEECPWYGPEWQTFDRYIRIFKSIEVQSGLEYRIALLLFGN